MDFAAVHYKSAPNSVIDLAAQSTIPILRPPLRVRLRSRWTVVWSLGSGVANDVDYVAAELSADGPRTLHECDAAGVLPSEAAAMESRTGRGIQPDPAEHAGRKPGAARSR